MGLADQAGSEMVPGWPLPVVAILVKETEPKFASGSARQTRRERHCAGACTIQSAEDRSGAAMLNCFVTLVRLVRFLIWRRTLVPSTLIDAVIVSPGATSSVSLTGPAGRSSYQA